MVVFGIVGRGCRVEARLWCGVLIDLTSLCRDIVVIFPVPLVEDVPGGPGLCGRLVVGVAVRFLFYLIHSPARPRRTESMSSRASHLGWARGRGALELTRTALQHGRSQ